MTYNTIGVAICNQKFWAFIENENSTLKGNNKIVVRSNANVNVFMSAWQDAKNFLSSSLAVSLLYYFLCENVAPTENTICKCWSWRCIELKATRTAVTLQINCVYNRIFTCGKKGSTPDAYVTLCNMQVQSTTRCSNHDLPPSSSRGIYLSRGQEIFLGH